MSGAVGRRLASIHDKGNVTYSEVARLLGTREETVSRWVQGHRTPRPNTEKTLLELEYIIDELSDIYEPNEARLFLFSPQRLLSGKKPFDLIQDGNIGEVHRLVKQVRDAVYL